MRRRLLMGVAEWDGLDDDGRAFLSAALGAPTAEPERPEPSVPAVPTTHRLLALFELAEKLGASDVHISVGSSPHFRVRGDLRPAREFGPLVASEIESFVTSLLSPAQLATLRGSGDLDAALLIPVGDHLLRIRASVFLQSGTLAAAFRLIATRIPAIEDLGLPQIVRRFADLEHGLVLVTGRTGSGKSTTLASMIETINRSRATHIVTVEDPIEFQYIPRQAVIQQREVGVDTKSFSIALRHALRQDPDVILLGELRDLETIRTALTAAETGHLVLATLHSGDTAGAIHRLIDVFPADQQTQIRSQLALSLQGILSQSLERVGERFVPITEVLVATGAVRNLIRDDKVHQLRSVIETGADDGMHTMEQSRALVPSW